MKQVINGLPNPLYFLERMVGLAVATSLTLAFVFGAGINKSHAEIISGFPDGIVCTFTTGSVPGPRVFYLVSDQDDGSGREIVYRQPRDGSNLDYRFDDTGAFVSDTVTESTTCDSKSIAEIVSVGDSFVFVVGDGTALPAGALLSVDAMACPSGWTRQLQIRGNGTPDSGVIVCRKD